ncbi:hypothetical protein LguiA_007088 [Lonicera macranthoides]
MHICDKFSNLVKEFYVLPKVSLMSKGFRKLAAKTSTQRLKKREHWYDRRRHNQLVEN